MVACKDKLQNQVTMPLNFHTISIPAFYTFNSFSRILVTIGTVA